MSVLLQSMSLTVGRGSRTLVEGLDMALPTGSVTAVLGANGAGKTTLLHTLAGLRPPASGRIELQGSRLDALPRRRIARKLGLLLQHDDDPFPATVLETALIGRHPHLGFWEWESREDVARARDALERMDLGALAEREVHTLSGGERRRLAMATLLTQAPLVMLLDEPTDQLDPRHQHALMAHLSALARDRGCAAMVSIHDVNMATRYCDHTLLLFGDGGFSFGESCLVLNAASVERLYGVPIDVVENRGWQLFLPR